MEIAAFPGEPYWRGWPAAVDEVRKPLDLDGDGARERVFIGTYSASLGGLPEFDAHSLVIISERSPLFADIDAKGLESIFQRQMSQTTAADSIPGVRRISFDSFLESLKVEPNGKERGKVWLPNDYVAFFNETKVFAQPVRDLPYLAETLVEIGVIAGEPVLLLTSKRDLLRDEAAAAERGELTLEYRFLVKYLGDFSVRVLCGEPVE
ncbi:MAG: hypothetical protein HXY21_07390 [Parvularculaceae bacterium]|nr:hypothetical protein [Parvularculaceae bacterium]